MKILGALVLLSILGCFHTEVRTQPRWPQWADAISTVCSGMADRNLKYVAVAPSEIKVYDHDGKRLIIMRNKKDIEIIESDTRFYLGVMEVIQEHKDSWVLEQHALQQYGMDK